MSDIRRQIERSSFGTPAASAARRSVSNSRAAEIVARANTIAKAKPSKPSTTSRSPRPRKSGG